jgi:hypothetical protein
MAWCPQCRNEYREGITECFDCHVPLVEELEPEEPKKNEFADDKFVEWANNHTDILDKIKEQDEDPIDTISEAMEVLEEDHVKAKVYRSSAQKAEECISSAWTLVIVGGVGLVAMILIITGIVPLHLASNIKYLSYSVMTLLFAVFLIYGIKSFQTAKNLSLEADIEEHLQSDIKEWFVASFQADNIDEDAFSGDEEGMDEMDKYYKRIDNIKEKICSKYSDLDDSFLDKIADDLYHEMFE